jgi:hypothetical protein
MTMAILGHHYRPPDWLTIREVARRLSKTPKTIRRWIHQGAFDEIAVINQRIMISPAAYQRFIEKHRVQRHPTY